MKITGPNGLVVDVPEAIATGLVGDGTRGYSRVVEEAPPAPKPRRRTKKVATDEKAS